MTSQPRVRVHLITFRRPAMLPRALRSLVAQEFRDWVCVVENGDPLDPAPAALVAELADPRITLHPLAARIGPVEAFNLAHEPAAEAYQSILEDDNWWEPQFLGRMVEALDARPDVELAWANMRTWRELPGNEWENTGELVWALPAESPPRIFSWPHLLQFNDFIYSNGSMLLRSRVAARLKMAPDSPRDMIEHIRERMMDFKIMLVPQPLVNFALTAETFRSQDYIGWGATQALLGAAFLRSVPMSAPARRRLWAHHRQMRPRSTSGLIYAGLVAGDAAFLRRASAADWYYFLRGAVRRPRVAWRTLRFRGANPQVWRLVCDLTAARTAEARARGFTELGADSLLDKQKPGASGLE